MMNYDPMGGISSTEESSATLESKDSQPDPPSATTSSFSTASPRLPVPLGTMIPNMWPVEVPESVKKTFAVWENQAFTEFKDQLKAVYRKKFTIATMKDHLMHKTRPADLCHKFVPFQNLPHSIHAEDRERHKANEVSLFLDCMQLILESRVVLLEIDLTNAKKILQDLQERTILRDKLLGSSPSLNPFMHAFDAYFTAFRSRVELALAAKRDEYERHVKELSDASIARRTAADTAAAAVAVDTDVTMTEDAAAANPLTTSSSTSAAAPGIFVRAAAAAPTAIPPGRAARVNVTPAPVPVSADSATLATLQAQFAQMSAALAQLTTVASSTSAPARTRTAAANQKGPKNSSGPGGRSTAQTPSRDGRASRPPQRQEDRQDRRQSRSRDRHSYRSPSRQPSRSDSSRYKRQPSPSRDRDDDRWHSNSRPRTSRRSPSPPPRQRHRDRRDDHDSDRGRSQRRESSRRGN